MIDYRGEIEDYIRIEIATLQQLDIEEINKAMNLLQEAYEHENTIYIFGNGGSASTASHFQGDFNKGVSENLTKKFRFICLNDNIPTMMAISNDIGYGEIFRYQLKGRLKPGDLVIAISGSGNSENIINAVSYAKEQGNKVIGITGFTGGKLKQMADVSMHVPVNSMQISEDIHLIFDHLMMSVFCKTMCGINHLKEM